MIYLLPLIYGVSLAPSQGIEGHWSGTLLREGKRMEVSFDFARVKPGSRVPEYFCPMDPEIIRDSLDTCPKCGMDLSRRFVSTKARLRGKFTCDLQQANAYPLDEVTTKGRTVHFGLGDGSLMFDGTISPKTLAGRLKVGGGSGTFTLTRSMPDPVPYRIQEVTFKDHGITLAGSLFLPKSGGKHAAVVLLHGSGPQLRSGTLFYIADRMARSGVVALAFDQRGTGESVGDWRTTNYSGFSDDAVAAVRMLQRRPEVDRHAIGVYGHSQGATIAPMIAARCHDLAFIIAADGMTRAAPEVDLYRVRNILTDSGHSAEDTDKAMAFYSLWLELARTGKGRSGVDAALPAAKKEKWYSLVALPPADSWVWRWYPQVAGYNPLEYWRRVRVPVLVAYGELDRISNASESVQRVEAALRSAGNMRVTAIIAPGAAHNLFIDPKPGQPFEWGRAAPGITDLFVAWVRNLP